MCATPGDEVRAAARVRRALCRLKPAVQTTCAMQALNAAGAPLSPHLAALARAGSVRVREQEAEDRDEDGHQ